mgnify:CR=1 FL=1
MHCDVGGGYPEAESSASKIPLQWMLREATAAWATKLAGQGRLGNWLTKQSINHVEELRGKRAAMDAVFHMHHFAHAQNDLVTGSSIGGVDARSAAAANRKDAGES